MTSKLNDFFNEIYVLNLNDDNGRWKSLKERLIKYDIFVKRIEGIHHKDIVFDSTKKIKKPGRYAIQKSYEKIFNDAVKNFTEGKILILEDDILINKNINVLFDKSIKNLVEYNVWYLGATVRYGLDTLSIINDSFLNADKDTYGSFAISLDVKFLNSGFLDIYKTNTFYNDFIYNKLDIQKRIVSKEFLFGHDLNYSISYEYDLKGLDLKKYPWFKYDLNQYE